MGMQGPFTTPAAAGGAGVAAATYQTPRIIEGLLVGVFVQYNDAPPAATTDIGIKTAGSSGISPSYNLLTILNAATDGFFQPRKQAVLAADGTVIAGVFEPFFVHDKIQLDIAGANDGDSISVWIYTVKG